VSRKAGTLISVPELTYHAGDYSTLRRGAVYMVFPYMAHDLAGLLENKKIVRLDQSLLKLYARQLLLGTSYLHRVRSLGMGIYWKCSTTDGRLHTEQNPTS
jgi:serine/threonine-protein kinase BUR1